MSDGVSEPGSYDAVLARARREHVTVSAIALGVDADKSLLRRIAKGTGGRFYDVPNASDLPRVLAEEAQRSVPAVAVRAPLGVRVGAAGPVVSGLSGKTLPPLAGVVLTRLRAGASAPLTTQVNGSSAPVLAQWQYGLGRVAVWTPGASTWSAAWLSKLPSVLTAAARWTERAVPARTLDPALGDDGEVVVDPLANSGTSLDLAGPAARVRTPSGATRELRLTQVAPSRYTAPLPGGAAGVYGLGIGATGAASVQALVTVPYAAELRLAPADTSILGTLAAETGGTALDPHDPAAALRPRTGSGAWRIPASAAIALLIAAAAFDTRRRR